jgi:hypothetical protein
MSEPRVLNAILAGIGAEDDAAVSQAERIICGLERAGYRITRAEISEAEEIKSLRARNAVLEAEVFRLGLLARDNPYGDDTGF